MRMTIEEMTGEQLLLMSVLHGRQISARIERQLDRRAAFGPMRRRCTRRPLQGSRLAGWSDGLLVA